MAKWQFYDPIATQTYTFEISPDSATMGGFKRNLNIVATSAPNGAAVKFEGRKNPEHIRFSGTLLTQEQYDALNLWAEKHYQIRITDDLNRQFWVYMISFSPSRQLSLSRWRHSWSAEGIKLDWT